MQIAGVLVLASGVPDASNGDNYKAVTIGYLIMRVGLISQWIRAAISHPDTRAISLDYTFGLFLIQLGRLRTPPG